MRSAPLRQPSRRVFFPEPGLALLRAIDAVDAEESKCDEDEKTGRRILKRALEAPTRQIAENSALNG